MPTPGQYGTHGPALWIPAFLDGCRTVVRTVIADPAPATNPVVGIRPGNNGRPIGAYRGGGWFYGLYWGGGRSAGQGSQEELYLTMGLGIEVTRVYAKSPTRDLGELQQLAGELYERGGRVVEILMQSASAVANACNASYAAMRAAVAPGYAADGLFRENFDQVTIGQVRFEREDWIAAAPPADPVKSPPPTIFVLPLTVSGLKFHKLLSECQS